MWGVITLMWLGTSVVSCAALLAACIISGAVEAKLEETRLINRLQVQQLAAMQHIREVGHIS